MTSDATLRANALVAERLPQARALGDALVELIDDPEAFVRVLGEGLAALADEAYVAEQARVAPGDGPIVGVRWPLVRAVARQLRGPLGEGSSASALWLAQRLARSEAREPWLFALVPLERALRDDPERAWQLLRRMARRATDWVSVDAIAELVAQGIIRESLRWAELEQLVYSNSRWERRLVGSTLARLPHQLPRAARPGLRSTVGLTLIKSLIGDADDRVQKALAWALRSWAPVDPSGVEALLTGETDRAVATGDGHRARVIREALPAVPAPTAAALRAALAGVRRDPTAPSTSTARAVADHFAGMPELADRAVEQQGERQGRQLAGSRA